MIEAFQKQRTLTGDLVHLVPLGPEHFDDEWAMLHEDEGRRLTGTHETFTEERVRGWLARVQQADDRADWAILRATDSAYVGQVVLNDVDEDNRAANFRISLVERAFNQGYGTEATRLAVRYAFEDAGLHRHVHDGDPVDGLRNDRAAGGGKPPAARPFSPPFHRRAQ